MKYNPMTRRMFLQGAGRMLPMPFLVSLLPRELWAQANDTTIRRYIGVATGLDYGHHSNWFPSLARPSQRLNSADGDQTLSYAPLSSYLSSSTSALSPIFGNSLNSILGSINLIRGLDHSTRIAHGRGHFFGNLAASDGHDSNSAQLSHLRTIDQVLRDNLRFNPGQRDVAVIGNESRSYRRNSSGTVSLAPLVAETPRALFNYLFDGGRLPESNSSTVPVAHPRRDLLTGVLEDYGRVRNGRQISSADRVSLDHAMDLISDIQRNLDGGTTTVAGSCRYKTIPTAGNGESYFENNLTLKAQADMIIAAIMCDVTRVFMWSAYFDDSIYDVHPTEDFHQGHSHIPFTVVNGKVNWQYMGEVQGRLVRNFLAPLLTGLASATDPSNGRSYLYNSLVHSTIECSQVHGLNSQPCLLAGNAGGRLNTGYYLDYSDHNRIHPWCADSYVNDPTDPRFSNEYVGVPVNRLYNTVLQSMGLAPADYEDASINTHFRNRNDGRYGSINNGIANIGGYGHWGPASSNYGSDYMNRATLFNLHHFKKILPMPPTSA